MPPLPCPHDDNVYATSTVSATASISMLPAHPVSPHPCPHNGNVHATSCRIHARTMIAPCCQHIHCCRIHADDWLVLLEFKVSGSRQKLIPKVATWSTFNLHQDLGKDCFPYFLNNETNVNTGTNLASNIFYDSRCAARRRD